MKDKNRVFYGLWSYIAVCIISILINMIGYNAAIKAVSVQNEKAGMSIAEHAKSIYDVYFGNVVSDASAALKNSAVQKIIKSKNISENDISAYSREAYSSIEKRTNMVTKMYVIFKDKDLQVGEGITDIRTCYNMAFADFYPDKEAWLAEVFSVKAFEFKSLTDKNGNRRIFLYYTQPSIAKVPNAAVITEINIPIVESVLKRKVGRSDNIIIEDENKNILFSAQKQTPDFKDAEYTDSKKYIMSRCNSESFPISYIYYVPLRDVETSINSVRNMFIFSYILCLAVCSLLAAYFSKINYRRYEKIEQQLKEKNMYLSKNILKDMIKGRTEMNDVNAEILYQNNIVFFGDKFIVIVFDLAVEDNAEKSQPLTEYVKKQLLKSIHESGNVFFTENDELLVGIINIYSENTDDKLIPEAAKVLSEKLKNEFNADIMCGIGGAVSGISLLKKSYKEAVEAMDMCYTEQAANVFVYEDTFMKMYKYDMNTESKLFDMLVKNKKKHAMEFIEQIFENNKQVGGRLRRVLAMEIISTIFKAAAEISHDEHGDYKNLFEILAETEKIKGTEEAKQMVFGIIDNMKCFKESFTVEEDVRITKIVNYINENYSDPDLNVNMIADKFSITPSYMSRYFKAKVGNALSDYIVQIRIAKAMEMLKNTDMKISVIAEKVGFSSVTVFMRAFKRSEGITAGEFREISVHKNDGESFDAE